MCGLPNNAMGKLLFFAGLFCIGTLFFAPIGLICLYLFAKEKPKKKEYDREVLESLR
jgi:hypothetical protein